MAMKDIQYEEYMRPTKSSRSIKKDAVRRGRAVKWVKFVSYSFIWLVLWGLSAAMLMALITVASLAIAGANDMSATHARSLMLITIGIIAMIFFLIVWLLRTSTSLFFRTSRLVLLVCTCAGILIGIPVALFGGRESGITTASTQQKEQPPQATVRRWQYMMCSDGSYRYYTDEQFSNPQVGFTEASEDACAKSGHGIKTTLADKPPESTKTPTPALPRQTGSFVPPPTPQAGCNYYGDIPYKTVKANDSNLKVGQTREIGGYNGWRKECKDSAGNIVSNDQTSAPTDKIIYYGTYTYEQALADARLACSRIIPAGSQQSTDWGDCIDSQMRQLW